MSRPAAILAPPDLPADWEQRDSLASYYDAIAAIGERVKAGAPVPEFMRGSRDWSGEG